MDTPNLKFFQVVVAANRNYATVKSSLSYAELPYPFSIFEVQQLRSFIEQKFCDVTIGFQGIHIDNPNAVYPEPKQVFFKNAKYILRIDDKHYLSPDNLSLYIDYLESVETSVKEFISTLCTPRF